MATVEHAGNIFRRIERFGGGGGEVRIEVLVSMERWSDVASFSIIICTLETRRNHQLQSLRKYYKNKSNKKRTYRIK